ncbi:aspartyl-phosphate phosphatase Spo0E family protein [Bacillus solitudinis]|uniref:aspartyl-phosphate phosphatase Spo0E family protein n=1 Tax=Bacillus solitudinis TaxID=2014074 RepID=UPI000C24D776|nr:aspartyl-phosphate phosphatase Spo0E family protein [Bacillus solitudinis]
MLLTKIEIKRIQMLRLAKKYGMSSQKTVQCSQELDMLLNLVQIKQTQLNKRNS